MILSEFIGDILLGIAGSLLLAFLIIGLVEGILQEIVCDVWRAIRLYLILKPLASIRKKVEELVATLISATPVFNPFAKRFTLLKTFAYWRMMMSIETETLKYKQLGNVTNYIQDVVKRLDACEKTKRILASRSREDSPLLSVAQDLTSMFKKMGITEAQVHVDSLVRDVGNIFWKNVKREVEDGRPKA